MVKESYRDKSIEELQALERDLRQDSFHLRNEYKLAGKVEKPHRFGETRRNLARVKTVLKEKQAAS